MADTLFDAGPHAAEPAPKESPQRRRTRRQRAALGAGSHPLGLAFNMHWPLHPEAAPADDTKAAGRRCGNCRFREMVGHHSRAYPKCLLGSPTYPIDPPWATHGPATDVRAWWPACRSHQYVPEGEDE